MTTSIYRCLISWYFRVLPFHISKEQYDRGKGREGEAERRGERERERERERETRKGVEVEKGVAERQSVHA